MKLTLFEAFFITHLVMDWIFQTNWEMRNKTNKRFPLLVHSVIYTFGFIPVFLFYKINFIWLGLIFLSHIFLDCRTFEIWLLEKFKGFKKEDNPESIWWILLIGIDQTFHLIILGIITLFS